MGERHASIIQQQIKYDDDDYGGKYNLWSMLRRNLIDRVRCSRQLFWFTRDDHQEQAASHREEYDEGGAVAQSLITT